MQAQGIALWRWTCLHRREIAATAALVTVAGALLALGPALLALAAVEWKHSRRRRRLGTLALALLLARAVLWLWRDIRAVPHGHWHPCAQCGRPIEAPSRAAYCSHLCRTYARVERNAQANDPRIAERAERRLRAIRLRDLADRDPQLEEVPY